MLDWGNCEFRACVGGVLLAVALGCGTGGRIYWPVGLVAVFLWLSCKLVDVLV